MTSNQGKLFAAGLIGISFLAFVAKEDREREYVPGRYKTEFKIDSCSKFVKCLVEDLTYAKWDYEYYSEGNMCVIAKNKRNSITIIYSGFQITEVYTDTTRIDSVITGWKNEVKLNSYETYAVSKLMKGIYKVYKEKEIIKRDSIARVEKQKLDSNLHARFYKTCN